jgi:hypothetical protein
MRFFGAFEVATPRPFAASSRSAYRPAACARTGARPVVATIANAIAFVAALATIGTR